MLLDTTIDIDLNTYYKVLKDLKGFIIYIPIDEIIEGFGVKEYTKHHTDIKIYVKTPPDETNEIYKKLKKDLGYLPIVVEMEEGVISILRYCGIDLTVYDRFRSFQIPR
jgi:hypothetical protein